jgi:two-component system, chemotaxis family, chemotaxis protein CheY
MRALVIDDSRVVRMVIGNILRELGMNVVDAADGRQGLEQLVQEPDLDLILVDWNMPVMNGLEFIRNVRAQRAFDRVRIMMVTTETECEQMERALRAGADEYLMKPFTKDVLIAKLSMMDVLGD